MLDDKFRKVAKAASSLPNLGTRVTLKHKFDTPLAIAAYHIRLIASSLDKPVRWYSDYLGDTSKSEPSSLKRSLEVVSPEPVIESVTCEAAGFGNCVHQLQSPAKRSFGQRVLECSGYRDGSAV
jgi:hypothetical protein